MEDHKNKKVSEMEDNKNKMVLSEIEENKKVLSEMEDNKNKKVLSEMEENKNKNGSTEPARSRALKKLLLQNVEGVNYLKFSMGCDLDLIFKQVRNVSVRDDDVIFVGFPRSGNHWTFEIVSMILSQTTDFHKDQLYSRLLEFLGLDVCASVDKIPSPRILATHCRAQTLPKDAIRKQTKFIYILRNPKDVLCSLYKFSGSLSHEGSTFNGSWDEFFDLQINGEFPWGFWFDHVLAMEAFQNEHKENPIFVLVYEKMKESPVEEITRLCTFLDKPAGIAEQIAEATEFSRMRAELGRTKMAVQSENHFKNGPNDILRKGVIGDWKNWFTVAQSEAFNKLFEAKMEKSKMGALVKEYLI
jgi:hypothetical protein